MNSSSITPHVLRFIGLVAVQSLLLNQMTGSIGAYFNVLLYPLFILFLPLQMAAPYLILLGFAVGVAVDAFVPSWGIHAGAGTFSAFARGLALMPFAPKGGFSTKDSIFAPATMGWQTFLQGTALFMAMHLLWYFSFSYFSHLFALEIVKKTAAAWGLTMIFVALYVAMFNPKK
ncbi:MAG: hypothetical protein J0M29_09175 [Chitinophagales bacterium]|nr:hypothetical protein [Chitinophagales bacterium]